MFVRSAGRYAVDVKYADQRVPNSPFRVRAGPPFDASKVSVTGPGVDGTPVAEEVAPFTCDVTEAGVAPLSGRHELDSNNASDAFSPL